MSIMVVILAVLLVTITYGPKFSLNGLETPEVLSTQL